MLYLKVCLLVVDSYIWLQRDRVVLWLMDLHWLCCWCSFCNGASKKCHRIFKSIQLFFLNSLSFSACSLISDKHFLSDSCIWVLCSFIALVNATCTLEAFPFLIGFFTGCQYFSIFIIGNFWSDRSYRSVR